MEDSANPSCLFLAAFAPLHLPNVTVPGVPFAGCSFGGGVGLNWTQPKGERGEREGGAGLGSRPPLQPPDRVLQCLYVLRFLQPALSPALQQQRSPLACSAPGAQRGLRPPTARSAAPGAGREKPRGPPEPPPAGGGRSPQPSSKGSPRGLGSPSKAKQPPQAKQPTFSTSPRVKQPLSMLQGRWSVFLRAAKLLWTDRQTNTHSAEPCQPCNPRLT